MLRLCRACAVAGAVGTVRTAVSGLQLGKPGFRV